MRPEVGDASREAPDEDKATIPSADQTCVDLCGNCFHGYVCSVATQVRQLTSMGGTRISIGECSYYMPMLDAEEEAAAASVKDVDWVGK